MDSRWSEVRLTRRAVSTRGLPLFAVLGCLLGLGACLRTGYDEDAKHGVNQRVWPAPDADAGEAGDGGAGLDAMVGDSGDPSMDGGADASMDGGADASMDGDADASPESGMDGGADASSESGMEAGTPNWQDTAWTYRKRLAVHSAGVGGGTGSLDDFPLLISFTSDPDLSQHAAQLDGRDILFTDEGGAKLDHELERFDKATGEIIAWVRIPTLSLVDDMAMYMYYGNAAGDEQNPIAVWDANFVAVHHMRSLQDSTAYANDAIEVGTPVFGPAGALGESALLDGNASGYALPDIAELRGVGQMTISVWLRMDVLSEIQTVVGHVGNDSAGWGLTSGSDAPPTPEGTNDIAFAIGMLGPSGQGHTTDSDPLSAGALQYWVAVYDGTQAAAADRVVVFIDGSPVASTVYGSGLPATTPLSQASAGIFIGTDGYAGTSDVNGTLDELRLSNTRRSAERIATEYENQRDPAAFVTAEPEESVD